MKERKSGQCHLMILRCQGKGRNEQKSLDLTIMQPWWRKKSYCLRLIGIEEVSVTMYISVTKSWEFLRNTDSWFSPQTY